MLRRDIKYNAMRLNKVHTNKTFRLARAIFSRQDSRLFSCFPNIAVSPYKIYCPVTFGRLVCFVCLIHCRLMNYRSYNFAFRHYKTPYIFLQLYAFFLSLPTLPICGPGLPPTSKCRFTAIHGPSLYAERTIIKYRNTQEITVQTAACQVKCALGFLRVSATAVVSKGIVHKHAQYSRNARSATVLSTASTGIGIDSLKSYLFEEGRP